MELNRSAAAIAAYRKQEVDGAVGRDVRQLFERRLLYFAEEAGHSFFLDRVQTSLWNPRVDLDKPRLVIDRELVGSWTEYATVWRCLFDFRGTNVDTTAENYFLF